MLRLWTVMLFMFNFFLILLSHFLTYEVYHMFSWLVTAILWNFKQWSGGFYRLHYFLILPPVLLPLNSRLDLGKYSFRWRDMPPHGQQFRGLCKYFRSQQWILSVSGRRCYSLPGLYHCSCILLSMYFQWRCICWSIICSALRWPALYSSCMFLGPATEGFSGLFLDLFSVWGLTDDMVTDITGL